MKKKTKSKPVVQERVREVREVEGVKKVTSLAELEEMVNRVLGVRIKFGNKEIEIPVRRLTPAESEKLELMLREVMPPMRKNPETGADEIDLTNKDYNIGQRKRERQARALALWWCCPLFKQGAGGGERGAGIVEEQGAEPNLEEITKFIEGRLVEQVLDELYGVARSMDLEVMARLGF